MATTPVIENPRTTAAARGRILIIDDEAEIRESLETLLEMEGYTVDLAANAAEGDRALSSRAYDLVLLDMMMPDRSGPRCPIGFPYARSRHSRLPGYGVRFGRSRCTRAEARCERLRFETLEQRQAAA